VTGGAAGEAAGDAPADDAPADDAPADDGPAHDAPAYVHPLAFVCGDAVLGPRASVWPFAVIRGDNDRITVGAESNVQDGAVLHADCGVPCTIGARVSVGHRAVVHGATVHDDCIVGIGAVVLNGAVIGAGTIVGAGAVVRERQEVPPGSLVVGTPARVLRATTPEELARIRRTAAAYVRLQARHGAGEFPRRGGA
jgi:carbonic anhydrase/acetyltransferase-like protein (isoleucine patch superfamily)